MASPRGVSHEEATPSVDAGKTRAKAKPKPQPGHPWWWHLTPAGIQNNLRYEARRLRRVDAGYRPTGSVMGLGLMAPGSMYAPLQFRDSKGHVQFSTPSQRDVMYGATVRPVVTAANLAINAGQRATNGWKPADPASTPVGRVVQAVDRKAKDVMGVKQDWQRSPDDLLYQQLGSDLTTSVIGGWAAKGLIPAAAFSQGAFRALSPAAQQAMRWGAGTGTESAVSTLLTDNRYPQGNLANAFGPDAPFAVTPKDDMVSALGKSLLPNAGGEVALGLGFLGLGKVVGKGLDGLNNITRRQAEGRVADEVKGARQFLTENGLQEELDGEHQFTPAAQEKPAAAPAEAPAKPTQAQAEEMLLGPKEEAAPAPEATPVEAPTAAAAPDETSVYGPELPEVDAAVLAADRLDDERLIAAAQGDGPVLPELERHLTEQDATFQLNPAMVAKQFSGPTENLAPPLVSFRDQWEAMPYATLKSLAHPENSPELFDRVQALTGRQWQDFTQRDVIDGLDALAQEGTTVIPNRAAADATVLPVDQVQVDPARFQYKDNVNAEGRQKGNSLDGVKQYNTDLEDRIDVWEDPADGQTYVVNGHNRLGLAKEKGISSIRVNYLTAQTAEQARALGALKNIAQGAGTPFDAAKAVREMGITDPAGLEAAGIPLQSGLGAQGLALSKLPDNLFQQAVNGELSLTRALSLGASGMDAEGMTHVVQLAAGRDMTDRAFSELTQMASTAPKVESDQMGLFGPEVIDTTIIKAELAAKVRAELTSNKNLFKKVGRQKNASTLADKAGTEVNTAQAQDAAGVAEAVLGEFDQTKYAAETPISQLLNAGAAEIAGGGKQAVVVRRILQQLEAAAEKAPPTPKAEVPTTKTTEEFWASESPEKQAQRVAEAKDMLLSERKLASRLKFEADQQALAQRVADYLDDMPGSNSGKELSEKDFLTKWGADESTHPQLPKGKATPKQIKELNAHRYAERYLAWHEANRAAQGEAGLTPEAAGPLTPEARKALKAEVIKKAIQNGEVRPSATPLPDLPDPPSDLSNPEAVLRDEIRLAEEYGVQDTIADQLALDAKRKAMGWDAMPLEEKKANGMLDEWEPWQPKAMSDIATEGVMLGIEKPIRITGPDSQALHQAMVDSVKEAIDRVTGDAEPVGLKFMAQWNEVIVPKEHGGDGVKTGKQNGYYDPYLDVINVAGMLERSPAELVETAYHESFHRVQYTLLTQKEMEVFDSVFGKTRVRDLAIQRGAGNKASIERQAYAFQVYAANRAQGLNASPELIRTEMVRALDAQLPRKDGKSWEGTFRGEAAILIFQAFDKVIEFIEQVNNAVRGRGFTSVQDLYEKAYSGRLAKSRALDFAAELITDDQVARLDTLDRWRNDNRVAVSEIAQMVASIDDQINALKAQAITGGC